MLARETTEYLRKTQRKDIFENARSIAIVGIVVQPYYRCYVQTQKLLEYGLGIAPVLPACKVFLGTRCYSNLQEVPHPVDIVQVYGTPEIDLISLAKETVEKSVKVFWMEEDGVPHDVREILTHGHVLIVEHENLEREYSKHFALPSADGNPGKPSPTGRVGDRMTRHPVTVEGKDTIEDAVAKMKQGHFSYLPVVGEDGRLIGMLSDRNLTLMHPSLAVVPHPEATEQLRAAKVEQAAVFNPVVVLPDASLEEAAELMLRWGVGALPVVAGDAYLSGIITRSDLLREFVARGKEKSKKSTKASVPVEW